MLRLLSRNRHQLSDKLREWWLINRHYVRENVLLARNADRVLDWGACYAEFFQTYDPCFVLSTGRCGTGLLAKLLRLSPQASAYHSHFLIPNPLLKLYDPRASDDAALENVLEACRAELIFRAYLTDRKYVETNNRLTFFARAAKSLFPHARFIHLVRHPVPFVLSGLRRHWYSGASIDDIGRLRGRNPEWEQMARFEQVAWQWNEVQRYAEEFKRDFPDDTLTVQAEELFHSPAKAQEIFAFIGIAPQKRSKIARLIKHPVNRQRTGSVEP